MPGGPPFSEKRLAGAKRLVRAMLRMALSVRSEYTALKAPHRRARFANDGSGRRANCMDAGLISPCTLPLLGEHRVPRIGIEQMEPCRIGACRCRPTKIGACARHRRGDAWYTLGLHP